MYIKTPNFWCHRSLISLLLFPASIIYTVASKVHFLYRSKNQKTLDRPSFCIGNITSGGVGKTPVVQAVAEYIPNSIVVIKQPRLKTKWRTVSGNTQCGAGDDEAIMLSRYVKVIQVKSRKFIPEKLMPSAWIFDDGFQDPSILYTRSFLVFNNKIGLGNGLVFPAGPLREKFKPAIKRTAGIILNGTKQKVLFNDINIPIFKAKRIVIIPENLKTEKINVFSGIAFPKQFFDAVEEQVASINLKKEFPDHHLFKEKELEEFINSKYKTITTEKDWVRLKYKYKKIFVHSKLKSDLDEKFYRYIDSVLKEKMPL
ncbi:MAG: tetraacyldisaccharide 4'-kinase [Alphaproteobacteria bacterium]|nr:tetraacyldisaccharide 4'-kinase [Alphaproteobacteria bacterium]MBL0717945.1 tetraacyldisaccharide 4'-kinase [Alphaproteobacteria bacterium]